MSSLAALHLLPAPAAFLSAPLARRDVNVFEQMEKLSTGLQKAARDLPTCFQITPRAAAKAPECAKVFEVNAKTEAQCSSQKFEDEMLGEMKCACKIQKESGADALENARPCVLAFCSEKDTEKVESVMKDLTEMALEQCELLPDYAKLIRDGFTATMGGETVTVPPAKGYPTTAFDFITETTKAAKPTNTSADSDVEDSTEEEETSTSAGAIPILPTKGASGNGTDEEGPASDSGAAAFSVKNALTFVVALMPVMAAVLL